MLIHVFFVNCFVPNSLRTNIYNILKTKLTKKENETNIVIKEKTVEQKINKILDYKNEIWHEKRYELIQEIYDHLYENKNANFDLQMDTKKNNVNGDDQDCMLEGREYTSEDLEEALFACLEESPMAFTNKNIKVLDEDENSSMIVSHKSFSVELFNEVNQQNKEKSEFFNNKNVSFRKLVDDLIFTNSNGTEDSRRKKIIINFALVLEEKLKAYFIKDVKLITADKFNSSLKRETVERFYKNLALRDFIELVRKQRFAKKSTLNFLEKKKFKKLKDEIFLKLVTDLEYFYAIIDDYLVLVNKSY